MVLPSFDEPVSPFTAPPGSWLILLSFAAGNIGIAEAMADSQAKNLAILKLRSITDDADVLRVSADLQLQDSRAVKFFDELTQDGAADALQRMATELPADNPLGDAARKLLQSDATDISILRGVAYDDIFNALRKSDIGDSVLLTDKMIISNAFMKDNKKEIVGHFVSQSRSVMKYL